MTSRSPHMKENIECQALKLFLSMPPHQRAEDIAGAKDEFSAISMRIDAFMALPRDSRTAPLMAAHYHDNILMAHVLYSNNLLFEDVAFYYVTAAAESVADDVCMYSAGEKGRLKALNSQMDKFMRAHNNMSWRRGHEPKKYRALCRESDALYDSIHDTIMAHIFEQYAFIEHGCLFETDLALFSVRREVGRRYVFRKSDNAALANDASARCIMDSYGPDAINELKRRCARLGLD